MLVHSATNSNDHAVVSAALLRAAGLSVTLGRTPTLQDVSFTLESGTLVGLVGPNGSGKTTLLRAICGLLPYQGSLRLRNQEVSTWKARALAQHVAFVRQGAQLSFDFTVREMVLLGLSPHKRLLEHTSNSDHQRAQVALDRVDLSGFEGRSMLSLSGGERQRVYLAQALVQNAELLLLDEPTTHLDVHHQHGFLQLVSTLVDSGRAGLAVFHDLELAARYCSHLLVLSGGRLVAQGPPQDTITEALLASVFQMRATVDGTGGPALRIAYLEPKSAHQYESSDTP